mgnify:CR=1 FL=1
MDTQPVAARILQVQRRLLTTSAAADALETALAGSDDPDLAAASQILAALAGAMTALRPLLQRADVNALAAAEIAAETAAAVEHQRRAGRRAVVPMVADVWQLMQAEGISQDEAVSRLGGEP